MMAFLVQNGSKDVFFRTVPVACLSAEHAENIACENASFDQLFLCLSRACLGKSIVFIDTNGSREAFFRTVRKESGCVLVWALSRGLQKTVQFFLSFLDVVYPRACLGKMIGCMFSIYENKVDIYRVGGTISKLVFLPRRACYPTGARRATRM
jgi:hypothetical protein